MNCQKVQKKDELTLATQQFTITDSSKIAEYDSNLLSKTESKQFPPLLTQFPMEFEAERLLKAKTPLLYGDNVELKRQEIRDYFHHTFSLFERLHDVLLNDKVFYYQPERLRHPLVFYFGHTAVFFLNKLNIAGIIKHRIDPSIESMCAIGVDEMSWDDLNPSHYNWPSIDTLRRYRKKVRDLIDNLILTLPLSLPINWESPMWIILMGIEHERIHLETSSVLFRQLPAKYVKQTSLLQHFPHMKTPDDVVELQKNGNKFANDKLIEQNNFLINNTNIISEKHYYLPEIKTIDDVKEMLSKNISQFGGEKEENYLNYSQNLLDIANDLTTRTITTKNVPNRSVLFGKSYDHHYYGWDNEYGQEVQKVPEFEISTKLITNAQFLCFILNGGYFNKNFWSEEGWKFAQYKTQTLRSPWPVFWNPIATELDSIDYPEPTAAILEEGSILAAEKAIEKAIEKALKCGAEKEDLKKTTTLPAGIQSNSNQTILNNTSQDDDYELLNSSDISGCESNDGGVKGGLFNSTMRVHPLQYPSQLSITGYKYRWLSGLIDMPWDWPVDINNLESQAFSKFVQCMLTKSENSENSENLLQKPQLYTNISTPLDSLLNNTPKDSNSNDLDQAVCRLPTEFEYRSLQLHILSTYGQLSVGKDVQTDTTKAFNYNEFDYPNTTAIEKKCKNDQICNTNLEQNEQNLSLEYSSSSPVNYYQYYNSGFYDVIGNVWQHCCSVIYPLKDFKVHNAYDDFTVPTFDNMHGLIIGGSWISTGNEACFNARYAFRRHFYQHAGARIGFFKNKPKTGEELQSIEQETTISNKLHADFYDLLTNQDLLQCESPNMKNILLQNEPNSKNTAKLLQKIIQKLKNQENCGGDNTTNLNSNFTPENIMVLGCRGGRLPIELALLYPNAHIHGIDTTTRLLGAGLRLMNGLQVSYLLKTSYQQTNFVRIREDALDEYLSTKCGINNPKDNVYNRIDLMQTDVCNLPEDKIPYCKYNAIIVDNLDTAYNPKLLLQNLNRHLVKNNTQNQSIVALNIYHQWEQDNTDDCNGIWGYRDETNGEFVDVERGIANIVPNCWNLAYKSDYNQRIRRVNERIYTFYDMTTYFYIVNRD